jgi:hypothetical protein
MAGDLDLPSAVVGWRFALGAVAATLTFALGASRRRVPGATPLVRVLDRLSGTLLSFERWVVDALGSAMAALLMAAAWTAAALEAGAFGSPTDVVSRKVERVAGAVRPVIGGSLERVFWAFVAVAALACVGHAVWPAR